MAATATDINRMLYWPRKAKWGMRLITDYLPHLPSGVMALDCDALLLWCRGAQPDFDVRVEAIDLALKHWRILACDYKVDLGQLTAKVWVVEGTPEDMDDAKTLITRACASPAETVIS